MTETTATVTLEILSAPPRSRPVYDPHTMKRNKDRRATTKDAEGWEHFAYRVRLSVDGRTMDLDYRQGTGHTAEPTAEDVLSCVVSDASCYESARDFEDFANDFGYDVDSRKAETLYRTLAEESKKVRHLLGPLFAEAMNEGGEDFAARICTKQEAA